MITVDDREGPAEFYSDFERSLHRYLVRLDKSDVHGVGVFARHDFPVEHEIGSARGPLVPWVNPYTIRDPSERKRKLVELTGPFRYANHADNANIFLRRHKVYTSREIKKGEELFLDYRKPIRMD